MGRFGHQGGPIGFWGLAVVSGVGRVGIGRRVDRRRGRSGRCWSEGKGVDYDGGGLGAATSGGFGRGPVQLARLVAVGGDLIQSRQQQVARGVVVVGDLEHGHQNGVGPRGRQHDVFDEHGDEGTGFGGELVQVQRGAGPLQQRGRHDDDALRGSGPEGGDLLKGGVA